MPGKRQDLLLAFGHRPRRRKMKNESFELKSSKYVLTFILSESFPFETILEDVRLKFERSARFFRNAQMAVSFQGRKLTLLEEAALIDAVTESCPLDIVCVIEEKNPEAEEMEERFLARALRERDEQRGGPLAVLIRNSVTNGQKLSFPRTVVVLGDVEPSAEIRSEGSIIVLGIAMGCLHAGISGDEKAFIAAMVLKPFEIGIASHKAVSAIRKTGMDKDYAPDPQIATIREGHISFSRLSGDAFNFLRQSSVKEAEA
jgi:septum site-determining protein MinC